MKKTRWIAALLAATMVLGMTACGSTSSTTEESSQTEDTQEEQETETEDTEQAQSSEEEVELTVIWWGSQSRADLTQEALELYEEENPGITFDGQFLSGSDYWSKLSTSAAGHTMADIVQMDKAYIQQYVENDMLVDLQPYVDSGVIDLSEVDSSLTEVAQFDGGLYAICIGVNAPALLYNKTLLEEYDIEIHDYMTMDEFLDVCREVYEKTGYKTNLQYNNGTSFMDYFLRAEGETIFDEDGEIGASQETIEAYFELYETGREEGWLIDPSVFAEVSIGQPEQEPLVYGSSPETMSWCAFYFSNNVTATVAAAPEGMEIGITTWPSDNVEKSNYLKPAMFFSISVDSEHPDEAADVVNWWINSVECNEILLGERGVPVVASVAEAITPLMSEEEQEMVAYINDVVTPSCSAVSASAPNGATEVYNVVYELEEAICYGEMTAADAAEQFLTQANEILANK